MTANDPEPDSPLLNWRTARKPVTANGFMQGDTNLAALGAVVSEPARARILLALGDGRARPASALAEEADVDPAAIDAHLARLLESGLVAVSAQGDCYELAGDDVGQLMQTVARLAAGRAGRPGAPG